MSNLAYKDDIILPKPPQYTCDKGKEAVNLTKKHKNEINYNGIQIIHTAPKMDNINKEKSKKSIGNELHEIFLRIQSHLNSESENQKS